MSHRNRMAVVIACGSRKQAARAPALYLYTGPYFSACRRWALSVCDPASVYVVSARYGLVTGDSELDPYDMRLGRGGAMASLVHLQAVLLGLADRRPVWFAGGAEYLAILRPAIPAIRAVSSVLPPGRTGRGIGAQLGWYSDNEGRLPLWTVE